MEGSTFLAAEAPPRNILRFRRSAKREEDHAPSPKSGPTEEEYRGTVMRVLAFFPEAFEAVRQALFELAGEVPPPCWTG